MVLTTDESKSIAAAAGVSVRTLNRFLADPNSVGEATRVKLAEILADPVVADPDPEEGVPTKRVYAPAIKAQGEKTWKEAAKLHRKLGSVKAVAEHYGCSGTAAARWVRQGEALLSKSLAGPHRAHRGPGSRPGPLLLRPAKP